MLGDNTQWFAMLRASGGKRSPERGREDVQLEEIPADQRAPILKAYLKVRREHDRTYL